MIDAPTTLTISFAPRGAGLSLFTNRATELLICGPANTGKSRACLEKVHLCAAKYPGARLLIVRKTRRSLTESGIVTWETKVQPRLDGVSDLHTSKQQYTYPNGSVVAVTGLDKPGKIMSSEWDLIYVQEATELTEQDWEALTTRLRNGKMPYQQLLADCNPDAPSHWLIQRVNAGRTVLLESRHEDNPTVTADYLARLDALSGVRLLRLRLGIWAAAEGMVYQNDWDRGRNVVDRFRIPPDWPRYLAVDFGYVHPFVCQWWAEDEDGRLYRYREIYLTHRLVEDHARRIHDLSRWGKADGEPLPRAIICDHDAEDRATLERHLGLHTVAAHKSVSDGIQAVAARMRPAGDGRARLFYLRDALVERDPFLTDGKQPACTEEEVESYVWDTGGGRKRGEEPVKAHDHGLDATRYVVAARDLKPTDIFVGPNIWE